MLADVDPARVNVIVGASAAATGVTRADGVIDVEAVPRSAEGLDKIEYVDVGDGADVPVALLVGGVVDMKIRPEYAITFGSMTDVILRI